MEIWKDSIDAVNKNLNHVLNKSLDSVKTLQNDIATIHHQIKVITEPIEWTINTVSDLFEGRDIIWLTFCLSCHLVTNFIIILFHHCSFQTCCIKSNNAYSSFLSIEFHF
jgi:hypothetical protein